MQRKRADIEAALRKKGFQLEVKEHRYYHFFNGERYTGIHTYVSTGSGYKDYGDSLLGRMAKQLLLDKNGLCRLVDCGMDEQEYRLVLKNKGRI